MRRCVCQLTRWKDRPGYRLSNGSIELVALLGGGHLVDLRESGSEPNALWEAPWPTIDPQSFSPANDGSRYGSGPAARLLSGYTGHALALPYFGMPPDEDSAFGQALHGEAATAQWSVDSHSESDEAARLVLCARLPISQFKVHREFLLRAGARNVRIAETVQNPSASSANLQWVQHAAFGPPFFCSEHSSLHLTAERAMTWPLGYDGTPLLRNAAEFTWPNAPTADNQALDLRVPFQHPGTGFVACVLLDRQQPHAAVLIHNRLRASIAGYVFEREPFPWVTLWEENCARQEPPWNGQTQVRGLEFGNTPFPLGLAWAERTREMFDTPAFTTVPPGQCLQTTYHLFLSPVPESWEAITTVHASRDRLTVGCNHDELTLDLKR